MKVIASVHDRKVYSCMSTETLDLSKVYQLRSSLSLLHTGFVYCVESCKSVILSCAVLEGRITSDEACDLALLESRHQVYL